jgi:hypothetical protein
MVGQLVLFRTLNGHVSGSHSNTPVSGIWTYHHSQHGNEPKYNEGHITHTQKQRSPVFWAWCVVETRGQALADHSNGGAVGLVFGAFGECSQSVDL